MRGTHTLSYADKSLRIRTLVLEAALLDLCSALSTAKQRSAWVQPSSMNCWKPASFLRDSRCAHQPFIALQPSATTIPARRRSAVLNSCCSHSSWTGSWRRSSIGHFQPLRLRSATLPRFCLSGCQRARSPRFTENRLEPTCKADLQAGGSANRRPVWGRLRRTGLSHHW